MAKRKTVVGIETETKNQGIEKLVEHFEEPLFTLSIITFILAVAGTMVGDFIGLILIALMALMGILSIYFIYIYFKKGTKNNWFLGIPVLIFLTALFAYYANGSSGFGMRDFNVFSITFGLFLLFYALVTHKILSPGQGAIFAVFFSAMIIHLAPAFTVSGVPWSGQYISALDPYFYYRHADYIVENGYVPEKDNLVYPTNPPDFSQRAYMVSVLMGSITTILNQIGISLHDVAMIYPGVFAAFTVLLLYLLIRDLFSDMRPYNYVAAILAAFMLMLTPSFAMKAIASNCEDDALGMFLLVSSFLLFTLSFRRKSLIIAGLAGFSLLLLNISWSGYNFAIAVLGIFASLYAIINYIHGKNSVEHIPYIAIAMLISLLSPLILHARGELPEFTMPSYIFLISIGGALFLSFLLEIIRVYTQGRIEIEENKVEDKIENLIQKNIMPIGGILIIIGLFYLITVMNPSDILNYVVSTVKGAKVQDIIGMTTAEQNPMCASLDVTCIPEIYTKFGTGALFGILMILVLIYLAIVKRSLGAIFVLCWSIPMLWGAVNKSQYIFTASVPVIALGSTIGLVIALSKKDLEGLRIIPSILIIGLPVLLLLIYGGILIFGPFGGASSMYMGPSADRIYWEPTLQWLGQQPEDIRILTWWDYGHWISAVSKRISLLDNTKAQDTHVQDVAKFHVIIENETEALEIARKYGATHVVIDYTMIGKSGAPHFIGTSNLSAEPGTLGREGSFMMYGQCHFLPEYSSLTPQILPNSDGGFDSVRTVVFGCNAYISGLIFEIKNNMITGISVADAHGNRIAWNSWMQDNRVSVLGVRSLNEIIGNALNYGTDGYGSFPTLDTLVYVPNMVDAATGDKYNFNKVMMTKLYLGDHIREYREFGLVDPDVEESKYFELVDGFLGTGEDYSTYGYVRVYKINYPEEET